MKKIVLVGNGILSLMTALKIRQKDRESEVVIIGPRDREGCASIAAPAMLNCFAELTKGSLDLEIDRKKFQIAKIASKKWQTVLDNMQEYQVPSVKPMFGTYILNNATTDSFDDDNFNAIIEYLEEFEEKYEFVKPNDIPGYLPSSRERALRAIFIKNEGFINSEMLLDYLVDYLKNNEVLFINGKVKKLNKLNNLIESVTLEDGKVVGGNCFQLSPGANFSKIVDNSNLELNFQKVLYGSGVTLELKPKDTSITNCVRTPNRGMACGVYSAPRTNNTLVVGASNLIADYGLTEGTVSSIESLLKAAMEQINTTFYNAGLVNSKTGWRPTSQDTYPLIGKTSISNLIVATGTKRDGFHMSPVIAEHLTSLIFNETSNYNDLFSFFIPEREMIKNLSRDKSIKNIVDHQISAMYQHDFVAPKSNMINEYKKMLTREAIQVHDKIGAINWGIPPELYGMYKGGYLDCTNL